VVARGSATSMGPKGWNPNPTLNGLWNGGAMESPVVTVLNIGETLIPCMWMLRVVHAQDVHNHPIDDLCLVVCLGVESSGFSELGVQQ
jgi:hypothetical protein